jgi:hypothetical protein
MKPDRRGSWYLLTGIVIGAALGLVYSWVISPVKYVDAPPYALRADYKDDYRAMVALAYLYSHDLSRADGRLAQLKDDNPAQSLTLQAQRAQADGSPAQEVSALNTLAMALAGNASPEPAVSSPTELVTPLPDAGAATPTPLIGQPSATLAFSQSITSTAGLPTTLASLNSTLEVPSSTPRPILIATSSSTPGVIYVLQETRLVCNISQATPLLQVEVRDAAGQPIPGVEMLVTWETGADHFFTGLQPEVSPGYADFSMTPGVTYSIQPAGGGQLVSDLSVSECIAEDGSHFWGSWYLVFNQP